MRVRNDAHAIAWGALLLGCGARHAAPADAHAHAAIEPCPEAVDAGDHDAALPDTLATLDDLANLAPSAAPGMREVARSQGEHPSAREEITSAAERDGCVRIAVAADAPVTARLEDEAGRVRARIDRGSSGFLGARGPICVRRGERVFLRVDADAGVRVRWIAWGTP